MISEMSGALDNLGGVENKTTTTVGLNLGRITINPSLLCYPFGSPGQHRFWFMRDELAQDALGTIVLADTRRLNDCSVDGRRPSARIQQMRPGHPARTPPVDARNTTGPSSL